MEDQGKEKKDAPPQKALKRFYGSSKTSRRMASPMDSLSTDESIKLACASFYMNRTNRSVIMGGGSIGGKSQKGRYGIDARFNKDNLIDKIEAIATRSESISVYNYDVSDFFRDALAKLLENARSDGFVYIDPPYVAKGPGLYKSYLDESGHRDLASRIRDCDAKWIATYDECPFVRNLYSGFRINSLDIGYSAYKTKKGQEVLISSDGLVLPWD